MKQALIILFFLPLLSFGQSKFSFGVNAGVKAGILNVKNANLSTSISEESKVNIGYSFGLDISYEINSNIFVRSGFLFENSRYRFETDGLTFGSCFDPVTVSGLEATIFENPSIKAIGIPVDLGYVFSNENEEMKLFFGAGIQYNVILNAEINSITKKETREDTEVTTEEGIEPANLSFKIFLGIETPFLSKYSIAIEPTIKYSTNKIDFFALPEATATIDPGLTVRLNF